MNVSERAEEDLQRLAAIVDSSDDAIVGKTLQGIVTSWNAGAERMFGYTPAEIVGRPITVLFPPDRLVEEAEILSRISRGERVEHFETVRVRKDGRFLHVSVTVSPIRNKQGDIVGASKIARDVTERVKLIAREQAARQEAEAASRMKDEFLATLSHELRTPLNAVFGWTRLLQSGSLEPAMQKHAVDVISRNCRAQLQLINDLLEMSRIVNGRLALRMETLDLAEVVQAAVDTVGPAATEKAVSVEVDRETGTPPVLGDPERLQQVVWNLLTNAIKFTKPGGWVRVRLYRAGPRVNCSVSDNGTGITEDLLPHVFEPFRQGESSTTRSPAGLGLGLAIVRHLVELHGGSVRAWSDGPGQGATFTVALPVAAAPGAVRAAAGITSSPSASAASQALKGLRVLVIDDDRDSRELIGEILRRAGAIVFTAGTAHEALGNVIGERPDVVVSDLGMPGEDGYSLIRRIRRLPDDELARVPALALTAYAHAGDLQLALAAGFGAYLPKPVEPAELVTAVARLATTPPGP
jgi:PAS domain S-box-containing protein